ncbi:hypothetical protein RIF29_17901 [Crotalaria pallida]|uniref:Uncharacterized protein n=1 Tax=Crotalaria pallida TaxID=3830 RepID=A0AAN9FIY7_CROPI
MGMGKKSSSSSSRKWWLKKMMKKEYFSSAFRWNKPLHLRANNIMDTVVFKVVSVVEGVVLVSTLCFFYLCCGCHF